MKIIRVLSFLAGFLVTSLLNAQQPPVLGGAAAATVRIPSHGASCTIIYSDANRTIMLGCGHAYKDDSRNKKMSFDIPTNQPFPKGKAFSKLLAVDYRADLSLVELDKGPFPFVAPVAPEGYKLDNHHIVAAGYDDMTFPPHQVTVHIDGKDSRCWYTKEKPWHGRSGGGLIDVDSGVLIGVCEGYELGDNGKGIYINLDTIHAFLKLNWPQYSRPPPQLQPPAPIVVPQKKTFIEIPREMRIRNESGSQCWACALETAARYLKIESLYDLTAKYKYEANFEGVEEILKSRHVRHLSISSKQKVFLVDSIKAGYPVAFGVRKKHMMLLVGIDDKKAWILANTTDIEVHEENINDFMDEWDGGAIIIFPGESQGNKPLSNGGQAPSSRQEFQYWDVGPVIPKEQFPNYQRQYIMPQERYVPQQQYVPQRPCPT